MEPLQTDMAVKPPPPRGGIEPAKKATIAVLTPTLGPIHILWHMAMLNLIWPMNTGKIMLPFIDRIGGEIGFMRNQLVKQVLDFDASAKDTIVTHIMFIDDDVLVMPAAMQALLSHDTDIAAGVYYCKGDFGEPLIFPSASGGTNPYQPCASIDDPDRCVNAYGWPLGLSLIKTQVFKRMRDELNLGEDKYGNPAWFKNPQFAVAEDGQVVRGGTEDFPFFENASILGYRPIVDQCGHAFGWHFSMAEKKAYPVQQWEMFLRKEPVVWPAKGKRKECVWQ